MKYTIIFILALLVLASGIATFLKTFGKQKIFEKSHSAKAPRDKKEGGQR
jgi:hypothetical protein